MSPDTNASPLESALFHEIAQSQARALRRLTGLGALVSVGAAVCGLAAHELGQVALRGLFLGVCGVVSVCFVWWRLLPAGDRMWVHFAEAGPFEDRTTLDGPGYRAGILVWAIVVVAIQCIRVSLSNRRAARSPADGPRASGLFNFNLGLQLKVPAAIFLILIGGWIVSYLRAP